MDERERIVEAVLDCGFDRVGVVPLTEAGDAGLAAWLDAGYHASMAWMGRQAEIRAAPSAAFAEYRTALVASFEYGDVAPAPRDPRVANISRYALGDDYHDVLKRRLFRAADRLRLDFPGLKTRAYVDTGPLNEKLLAMRAGLGWQGKHTNLIDPARGSYLFLGVLLVDVPLQPEGARGVDRCGLCEACIPACPTRAIVAPYVLDARRCISYLTIDFRGPIPRDLRPLIGNRVFGCDDCQEVCPWNRFARRGAEEPFRPREGLRSRQIGEWLVIDRDSWRAIFRRSAVKRARYEGFLRNLLVAAGNSEDPSLVPEILPFLHHADPVLRGHAAWALGRLLPEDPGVRGVLVAAFAHERDPGVRGELTQVLGEQGVA